MVEKTFWSVEFCFSLFGGIFETQIFFCTLLPQSFIFLWIHTFPDFQNYLRTQTGSTTTINIIICTVDYLLRLQVRSTAVFLFPWLPYSLFCVVFFCQPFICNTSCPSCTSHRSPLVTSTGTILARTSLMSQARGISPKQWLWPSRCSTA